MKEVSRNYIAEEFRQAVYELARLIPCGRATTYGTLARAAGYPAMSRMAGKLMAGCAGKDIIYFLFY